MKQTFSFLQLCTVAIFGNTTSKKRIFPSIQESKENQYHTDLRNLRYCIGHIKQSRQLLQTYSAIIKFKAAYKNHIDSASLNYEINQLNAQLIERGEKIESGEVFVPTANALV